MKVFSHNDLVEIGYKWCLAKCAFAFKELVTLAGEIPDVIGFNSSGSFLLEAKVSRSDFLTDKKKFHRINPEHGMGDWRFYIAPKKLINIDELPDMWGLIEVNGKGRARTVYNPFGKGNVYCHWKRNPKHSVYERGIMYSALRRLQQKKLIDEIYN